MSASLRTFSQLQSASVASSLAAGQRAVGHHQVKRSHGIASSIFQTSSCNRS